jgi:hypothetical protein
MKRMDVLPVGAEEKLFLDRDTQGMRYWMQQDANKTSCRRRFGSAPIE